MTRPDYKQGKRPNRRRKTSSVRHLQPGADSRLKSVFARIGIPRKEPFVPDPFQEAALAAINKGDCLVTVPTGSGKTWIAEQTIARILDGGGRAWYASPLKALTNSKYAEFSDIFGASKLGILTGDRKENPDAPVIVGTTEILRNQLYDAMHRGEDLSTDFVVLDEAHFLGDEDRGVVWEEIMIYLPSRIPLMLLSATIGNADAIAAWLESIRGRSCIVIAEKNRPVPLYPLFLHPSGTLFPMLAGGQRGKPGGQRLNNKVFKYLSAARSQRMRMSRQLPPMGDVLQVLKRYNLLPAIFFLKSRADCDNALLLSSSNITEESPDRKTRRAKRIDDMLERVPHLAGHKQMHLLRESAIGAHHSGQLPAWKIIIENLMTEGLLDAVFATSTVAAGVNFPARTIVFLNSDRFNGREFVPLTSTEFHQMTGRAGRRGMDKIGFAVVIPGRFMDIELMALLFSAPPSDVHSQIKINFSMVLNLLLSHSPEQIRELLEKSFAAYLLTAKPCKKRTEAEPAGADATALWHEFTRRLDFLKEKEYVSHDNQLTEDGQWASQLRIDHPLMVGEGFRQNLFPRRDPALLTAIMATFVNERETDDAAIDPDLIPRPLMDRFKKIVTGLEPFAQQMRSKGFEVPTPYFLPALTLYLWARGMDWDKVADISQMAEGDLAMLIMRTADNLRHIRNIGDAFPDAARAAAQAVELILRDPVVSTLDI